MASLVTGATGFIGQNLIRELVSRGESVISVSRHLNIDDSGKLVSWRRYPDNPNGWNELLQQVSTIYHFAWSSLPQTSNEDPLHDASDNIVGTLGLLEAAKKRDGIRIVFASSGGTIYGLLAATPVNEQHQTQPRCAYGVSKLAVEKYLYFYREIWGLDCVALRISNVYGPGQKAGRNFGAITTFANRAIKGDSITIFGDGAIMRDYIYINDLIEAIIAAGSHRGGPIVMNIGSGIGKSLNDIVDVLQQVSPKRIKINYAAGRNFDVPVSVLDISLAKTTLEWTPRTQFEIGVKLTFKALGGA
jgi:UDP-glucose 4-epimerase